MRLRISARAGALAATFVLVGVVLSGCFDLVQSVSVGRDGSGHYRVAVTAQGFIGEALKNEKIVDTDRNHADLTTTEVNGKVTRTAAIDFKSLSDLALKDETMSLAVKSRDLFGLGPAHLAFRYTFMVDRAKAAQTGNSGSGIGKEIAQTILGDHFYSFTVTVPGDIEHIAPVSLDGQLYQPTVTGDFYNGRTVTWRIPLYALFDARAIDFEVDFTAMGFFKDAKSQMTEHD
jgi:hypothetical protein